MGTKMIVCYKWWRIVPELANNHGDYGMMLAQYAARWEHGCDLEGDAGALEGVTRQHVKNLEGDVPVSGAVAPACG